ncbi:PREDICTED: uncharacterized protein LOC104777554 [Camelina sativa]|uniref:Uncharacterized protein LOC104777554 n=1 Tax=Camelina sativa TaxID=90675 RepID=A0ABM0YFG0_CAMSA|nr:PREDICTED: uncharacterized protein LOC104777554 [Camelina sativa]
MEGPLLTEREDIKIDGDSLSNDEHNIRITVQESSSPPHEAKNVEWCNPCTESSVWFIELVMNLVQVVAAIFVMNHAKDEHPETAFLVWIIGYTCGCVVILLIELIVYVFSCVDEDTTDSLKNILKYFLVVWVVLLIWIYSSSLSSLYDNTQHFWLCMGFVVFTCIRYVPDKAIFSLIWLGFVVIIWIFATVLGTTPFMCIYQIFLFLFKIVYYILFVVLLLILMVAKELLEKYL